MSFQRAGSTDCLRQLVHIFCNRFVRGCNSQCHLPATKRIRERVGRLARPVPGGARLGCTRVGLSMPLRIEEIVNSIHNEVLYGEPKSN